MTISLISLIESAQARYTDYFFDAVARAKSDNPDVVSEFLIPLSDDSIPYPYRHFRADLMGEDEEDNTRAVELWQDPPTEDHDPESRAYAFDLGIVKIEIHPFTWCSVQIGFDHALSDEAVLGDFLDQWFDPEDRAYHRGEPLSGAIHSATRVETLGSVSSLTIDFGTAPTDALIELLETLAADGATHLIIASQPRPSPQPEADADADADAEPEAKAEPD